MKELKIRKASEIKNRLVSLRSKALYIAYDNGYEKLVWKNPNACCRVNTQSPNSSNAAITF